VATFFFSISLTETGIIMSYQVLARKWRPQNFVDMVGQDHISSTLCNAIQNNRVGHAYLFVGTRGTGKTTTARIFAKAINCENPLPDANPCDQCTNCKEITAGSCMDVLEIDGASNNGVDDIRRLRDNVQYTPARCPYKVYIIDEVHMLSTAAWNALLKTLEEPPEHVKFFFATTEAHKVLPTILSRCQRFDLKRITQGTIARRLLQIANEEKASFDEAAINAIARAANGGMRDALSIMDQLIAFCSNKEIITEVEVSDVFGLTSNYELARISIAILNNDAKALIQEINRLADLGRNLEQLYNDLLHFSRNLMICAISGAQASSILDLDEYELKIANDIVAQSNADTLQRMIDGYMAHDGQLKNTLNKRVFLEMTLIRIMREANAVSLNDILKRLNELKKGGLLSEATPTIEAKKNIQITEPEKKKFDVVTQTPIQAPVSIPIQPLPEPIVTSTAKLEPIQKINIAPEPKPLIISKAEITPEIIDIKAETKSVELPIIAHPPKVKEETFIPITIDSPDFKTHKVERKNINDSYELPYSTFLDEEFIHKSRIQDPLQLGLKRYQKDFSAENETPGSALGLYYYHDCNTLAPRLSRKEDVKNAPIHQQVKVGLTEEDPINEVEEIQPKESTFGKIEEGHIEEVLVEDLPLEEDIVSYDITDNDGPDITSGFYDEYIPDQSNFEIDEPEFEVQEQEQPEAKKPTKPLEVTPEKKAEEVWESLLSTVAQSPLIQLCQSLKPVSYSGQQFYISYDSANMNAPTELQKAELQEKLSQLTHNQQLDLKLFSTDQSVQQAPKNLTSDDQVWARVNSNPIFSTICKEFNGNIIDVRG
jgi:DNA polymerase III subunit gamma/tau